MASQTPVFPACSSAVGTSIASYPDGIHAIVGQGMTTGSDDVYAMDGDLTQVVQCYCPQEAGSGIQTNWLDAANLSDDDKQALRDAGWIYVADGSTWGLTQDPYFAQNMSFSCPGGSSNPTTITAVVQSSDQTNSSSSNNSGSSSNNNSTPSTPSVPLLPDTGDSVTFFGTILLGIVFFGLSLFIRKRIR